MDLSFFCRGLCQASEQSGHPGQTGHSPLWRLRDREAAPTDPGTYIFVPSSDREQGPGRRLEGTVLAAPA